MSEMRMSAYYFGFEETGDKAIDKILSAVACAGKAYHHTGEWNDGSDYVKFDGHTGGTPVDWIQNAAKEAKARAEETEARCDREVELLAASIRREKELEAERDELKGRVKELEGLGVQLEERFEAIVELNKRVAELEKGQNEDGDLIQRIRREQVAKGDECAHLREALEKVCASCQRHLCQDKQLKKVPGRDIGLQWGACQSACYVYAALSPGKVDKTGEE
jgi:predicted RNase H-like nuclease (RuvC/YqgF family)